MDQSRASIPTVSETETLRLYEARTTSHAILHVDLVYSSSEMHEYCVWDQLPRRLSIMPKAAGRRRPSSYSMAMQSERVAQLLIS